MDRTHTRLARLALAEKVTAEAGMYFAGACREAGIDRGDVTVTADAQLPSLDTARRWVEAERRRHVARHRQAARRNLDRNRAELAWLRRHGPLDCWGQRLAADVAARADTIRPTTTVARRRGAGRPARRAAARSSARSGDSGDGSGSSSDSDGAPALAPSAVADARRILDRAARRLLAEGVVA